MWPRDSTGRPRRKAFLADLGSSYTGFSTLVGEGIYTRHGTADIDQLFGERVFDFPKPVDLIRLLVDQCTVEGDIVLDFFAGSCATGHAVLKRAQELGQDLRFILIQLPEKCFEKGKASAHGYKTIADIGKVRLSKVLEPGDSEDGTGFKVFKLSSSNIKPWDASFDTLDQDLYASTDNIKPDRSPEDVLYELLLKYGLDLAIPVDERIIAGKTVFIIGAGALVVCLDSGITLDVVRGIAELKTELSPEVMRVVFKDASFADDVVKANTVQILKQAGVNDVKSL